MRTPIACLLLAGLGSACRPALPRQLIDRHPALATAKLGPVVVEASEPAPPPWILRPERGAVEHVDFVGQASATGVDTARAEAMRDLLSGVAHFVAVEVESTFESVETHRDGAETQDVRSQVRAHAQAAIRAVKADAFYWERVAASAIDPAQTTVRYYVRARVPKAEISRARLAKQLERQRTSGRTMVVVTPLVATLELTSGAPADATVAALARAIGEDLARALAAHPALHVVEPSIVDSVLPSAASELERLEAVHDALLADRVVSGTLQRSGEALEVHYTIRRAGEPSPIASGRVAGTVGAVFALELELGRVVLRDLAITRTATAGAVERARADGPGEGGVAAWSRAERAYAESWEALEAGQSARALELARAALSLRPHHAPTALRVGRILERLGRFGRIVPAAARAALPSLLVCRDESRGAAAAAVERLRARAAARAQGSGAPAWIEPGTPTVDAVLAQVMAVMGGGSAPLLEGPRPTAAASAYAAALGAARRSGDPRAEREALLALADLAVRVDRIEVALQIYARLREVAEAEGDHHTLSLALYGSGVAERRRGAWDRAIEHLRGALVHRAVLGEKPYFLEIYSELGGTEVERGQLAAAHRWYRQAQQIAEDLGAEYFRAVLANNLGVLAWREGRTADAEESFAEALAYLGARGDAEGAIAALLNGAEAAARRGDPEEAARRLGEAARRVEATDQEGRRAALALRRATVSAISSAWPAALDQQHEALSMAVALGQQATARRAHGAVLAAELRLPGTTDAHLACLRQAHAWLAAPAVVATSAQVAGPWRARLAEASPGELALAHDAQVVEALAARVDAGAHPAWFSELAEDGMTRLPRPTVLEVLVVREVSSERGPDLPPRPEPPRPPPPLPVRPSAGEDDDVPTGTAAGAAEDGPGPDAATPPRVQPKTAPYERILGAFESEPQALVLLSPHDLPRLGRARFPGELVAIAARARALSARRIEAAARLNVGALLWARGQPVDAYRALVASSRLFAGLGDAEGLAAAHEWVGFALRESDAIDPAAENLALARALFARIEDGARADGVLEWGDRD